MLLAMDFVQHLPSVSFVLGAVTSLFSVLDPIGGAVLFAGATTGMPAPDLARAAKKAALTAGVVMVTFALLGQFIFHLFGFSALAMRFVGGVLIAYQALSMIYGDDPRERSTDQEKAESARKLPDDFAIIPFGIPLLAGAGTISTVMGMIVGVTWAEYAVVIGAIILNAWAVYLFLRKAPAVLRRLGANGKRIVTKFMGLILAAVAMQFLINGVKALTAEIKQEAAARPAAAAAPR